MGIMFFYGVLIGMVAGGIAGYIVFNKPTVDENDSQKIQTIIDRIDLIIDDIKKTV